MKTNIIKGIGAALAITTLSLIFTSESYNGATRNLASDSIMDNLPMSKLLNSYKVQLEEKLQLAEVEKESIGPTIENEKKLLAERAKKEEKAVASKFNNESLERILHPLVIKDESKKESIGPTIENEKKLLAERAKKEEKVAADPAKKEETIESLKIKIADLEKKIEADKKIKDEAKDKEVVELRKEVKELREKSVAGKARKSKAQDLIAQLRALFGDKAPVAAAPVAAAPDNSAFTAVLACMQETQKTLITMIQGFSSQQNQQVNQMGNPFDVMDKTFSMMQKYGIGQGFSSYNNQQPMGQNNYTPSFGGNQMIAPVSNYPRNMINTVIGNSGYGFQNNNQQVQPCWLLF